jgi:hypothetical protein
MYEGNALYVPHNFQFTFLAEMTFSILELNHDELSLVHYSNLVDTSLNEQEVFSIPKVPHLPLRPFGSHHQG